MQTNQDEPASAAAQQRMRKVKNRKRFWRKALGDGGESEEEDLRVAASACRPSL